MKTGKAIKKTKWVLGIFPQGTRQLDGEIKNLTKGFASIAKSNKCGVLPVGIIGTNEVKRIPFTGKIIVNIGEIIPYTDNLDEMVDNWGKAVEKLTGFKYVSPSN
jgi:1-acyl-sn-glycerol-3-phosphate acyltransferase